MHLLFPPLDDAKPDEELPDFAHINVTRIESTGQAWCPRMFTAQELTNIGDVFELFGGGTYELIARRADGRVAMRRRYNIPGRSLPLEPEAPRQEPPPSVQHFAPPSGDRSEDRFLALITMMMQMQQQSQQMMMQMLTTTMTNTKQESKDFVQAMAQLTAQDKGVMGTLLTSVLANQGKGGGGSSVEDAGHMLVNVMELSQAMKGYAAQQGPGESSMLSDVVQAMSLAAEMAKNKTEANGAPSVSPPLPSGG